MNNEYFILNGNDFNILFHRLTSKIAILPKEMRKEELNYEELDKKLENEHHVVKAESSKYGKGKITLNYMSSRTCNLGCQYCFAGKGEYGNESCKPNQFTYDGYVKGLQKAFEHYPEGVKRIDFFGGEPLLNYQEIKKFLPLAEKKFEEHHMKLPDISITTNSTLLTEEVIDFIKKYKIRISLSLDGEKKLNDQARKYKSGTISVYDKVVQACSNLEAKEVPYAIQATINANHIQNFKTGDAIRWIQEMEKLNYYNISIIPVETDVETLRIQSDEQLRNLDSFTRELTNYFLDKIQNGDTQKIPSLLIMPIIQLAKHKYMRSCTSGQSFIWDTDGKAYPCHMFVNAPEHELGNMEVGLDKGKVEKILKINREDGVACQQCIAKNVCSVWCKGIQFLSNKDMYEVCKPRCTFQKAIVEECILRLGSFTKSTEQAKIFWNNYKQFNESLGKELEKLIH